MCGQRQDKDVKTARGGFTLMELLVVMSIVSMLMALLLPNLPRARRLGIRRLRPPWQTGKKTAKQKEIETGRDRVFSRRYAVISLHPLAS